VLERLDQLTVPPTLGRKKQKIHLLDVPFLWPRDGARALPLTIEPL
jgi:hypothetical protein